MSERKKPGQVRARDRFDDALFHGQHIGGKIVR